MRTPTTALNGRDTPRSAGHPSSPAPPVRPTLRERLCASWLDLTIRPSASQVRKRDENTEPPLAGAVFLFEGGLAKLFWRRKCTKRKCRLKACRLMTTPDILLPYVNSSGMCSQFFRRA